MTLQSVHCAGFPKVGSFSLIARGHGVTVAVECRGGN